MKKLLFIIFLMVFSFAITANAKKPKVVWPKAVLTLKDGTVLNGYLQNDIHFMKKNIYFLTSSLRTPKFFIKEFSDFLMPCHQHGLRINLLVQRQLNLFGGNGLSQWPCLRFISVMFMLHKRHVYNLQVMMLGLQTCFAKDGKTSKREHFYPNFA